MNAICDADDFISRPECINAESIGGNLLHGRIEHLVCGDVEFTTEVSDGHRANRPLMHSYATTTKNIRQALNMRLHNHLATTGEPLRHRSRIRHAK